MELDKTQRTNDVLKIWQQNLNKSSACQHDLISSGHLYNEKIDIVVLQEPSINFLNKTIATHDWIVIYPTTHAANPKATHAIFLIRSTILTNTGTQIDFPSGEVTAIHVTCSRHAYH